MVPTENRVMAVNFDRDQFFLCLRSQAVPVTSASQVSGFARFTSDVAGTHAAHSLAVLDRLPAGQPAQMNAMPTLATLARPGRHPA